MDYNKTSVYLVLKSQNENKRQVIQKCLFFIRILFQSRRILLCFKISLFRFNLFSWEDFLVSEKIIITTGVINCEHGFSLLPLCSQHSFEGLCMTIDTIVTYTVLLCLMAYFSTILNQGFRLLVAF